MKLLAPTGFARLDSTKAAIKYAARRLDEGCDVKIVKDSEGKYRVEFEPSNERRTK